MWVQFSSSTGEFIGAAVNQSDLPILSGTSIAAYPEWDDVPPLPWEWNPALRNFALPQRSLLTQQEFMDRWVTAGPKAEACMDQLFAAEPLTSASGTFARKTLTRFRSARGISPEDPRTVALTDTLLNMGVTNGILTVQEAADARLIILAAL